MEPTSLAKTEQYFDKCGQVANIQVLRQADRAWRGTCQGPYGKTRLEARVQKKIPYIAAELQGYLQVQYVVVGDVVLAARAPYEFWVYISVKIGRDLFHGFNLPWGYFPSLIIEISAVREAGFRVQV